MSRSWAKGSTRQWRKTRARTLARYGHVCQLQLPGCTHVATHAHHIAGRQAGDNDDNLTAACQHCNLSIGDPTRHDPNPTPTTRW